MNWKNYWQELKRRNVIKAGLAYLIIAWLVTQVLSIVLPTFEAPEYILKTALILIAIGFPIWIIFSWVYEFTPNGIKKTETIDYGVSAMPETGKRLNKVIIIALTITIIVLIVDKFMQKSVNVIDYGEKSIAVLAFTDMSPDKDQEYFSDGISEELLNKLAKIPELKVISRTSSFSYKGKNSKVTEIGEELNVTHVLEGSIRKSGNTVRITAQLINTSDGSHEWSNTYDRNLDSIFKIQDEISAEVSNQLRLKILGQQSVLKYPKTEAYTLYLQANYLVHQNTKKAYITAESLVKKSIEIEPNYADAWLLLANIYDTGMYNFSIRKYNEGIKLGIEAANKAIKLDPNSGKAYVSLSSLQNLDWNFNQSSINMDKALALSPNDAVIIGTAAIMTYGDIDKSVKLLLKAISLDPLVYENYYNLGHAYYKLGKLNLAEEAFKTFAIYYPNSQILHYMMANLRLAQGRLEDAKTEIEQETHEFFSLYGKNFVYFALGKQKEADALLKKFIGKYSEKDPANLAGLYAFRGDYDKSFYWLNRALEIKDPVLIEALSYPYFESMYNDIRWTAFIKKIGLPKNSNY
jgi:adenylate cyclase